MARNDEGEFELVLGNRQLVSVFLIVVILLGVFFSMGYIVGPQLGPGLRRLADNAFGSFGQADRLVDRRRRQSGHGLARAQPTSAPALRLLPSQRHRRREANSDPRRTPSEKKPERAQAG